MAASRWSIPSGRIFWSLWADILAGVAVRPREHIDAFTEAYNQHAKPFAWTKTEVHQRRLKDRRIGQL
jgi:hypothetical protein